jgi:DNA polymerase-3 subunit gamma/tau
MAEYQVIARKWRPQCFADVVGQEHVVRTLKNAIIQNRTAHAYLFVGPRGVGKTTLARIFAKALNCEHPRDGEPCCECGSCRAIAAENSLDVIEIDAASRNSAADMRELADEVMHAPVAGRYKIYIIDEVHMLSKAAWNALLKTVEEPPAHVKFIFATTEVHQVLPTIISRCQRFDLLPITTRLIATRLALIAKSEQVDIEPAAVNAIARAADGGMRDAQSLLDQMIAFFASGDGAAITGEQVLSLFGLTGRGDLFRLLRAMLENRPGEVVAVIHSLAVRGKNLETLFDDLLGAWRAIRIVLVVDQPADILEEDDETIAEYGKLAKLAPGRAVAIFLETLAPIGRVLHDALNKQVYLETIILKAMREAHAVRLEDILARLNQLRSSGELAFLDRIPAGLPAAAAEAPNVHAEKKTAVDAALVTHVSAAPPPEVPEVPEVPKAPPASAKMADPAPAAAKVEVPAAGKIEPHAAPPPAAPVAAPIAAPADGDALFLQILAAAGTLASHAAFSRATAESLRASVLTVGCGPAVSDAEFKALAAERTAYIQLLQRITGDWASDIVFVRRPAAAEACERAPEPPEMEDLEPLDDVADDAETAGNPPAIATADAEAGDDGDEDAAPAAPVAAALSEVIPEPPPPGRAGGRGSIINDRPGAIEAARRRPVVRDVLDLFGGEIKDIHEPL